LRGADEKRLDRHCGIARSGSHRTGQHYRLVRAKEIGNQVPQFVLISLTRSDISEA
jgi:hypothetical protein